MRRLNVIGIGAGNPEYLTVQAINALNRTDVFFFTDKGDGESDLLRVRNEICERYADRSRYRIVEMEDPARDDALPYEQAVREWHEQARRLVGGHRGGRAGRWSGGRVSRLGGSGLLRQHVEDPRGSAHPWDV